MAKKDYGSLAQKMASNRLITLGIVVILLLIFALPMSVFDTIGGGGPGEGARFRTPSGRTVVVSAARFQNLYSDWNRCSIFRRRQAQDQKPMEVFLTDLMLHEMAVDAGIVITDGTLREFIEHFPLFTDRSEAFDPDAFDSALATYFGGVSVRSFEEQARRFLTVDHYYKMYATSFLMVGDGDAYEQWKGDHPKLIAAYAWQPVAPVRESLDPASVTDADLELFWQNPRVQDRHRVPVRFAFDAVWASPVEIRLEDFQQALLETKDDPDLRFEPHEAYGVYFNRHDTDYRLSSRDEETRNRLFRETLEYTRFVDSHPELHPKGPEPGEDDAVIRVGDDDGEAKDDGDGNGEAAPPSGDEEPTPSSDPDGLPPKTRYDQFWRAFVEKDVWLRRLLDKAHAAALAGKKPLEEIAREYSRPGITLHFLRQEEPVDQYGVEKIEGLGGPNCGTRYAINSYRKEQEGNVHPHVVDRGNVAEDLAGRGGAFFQVRKVLPTEIPPLADVREKVLLEALDERAGEQARARLEALRNDAEKGGGDFEAVAVEAGYEVERTPAFNEFSWRPPLPRREPGETPEPAADEWKNRDRRLNSVMGRYYLLRDNPVGTFAPTVDDVNGTGAFYLVKIEARAEPVFEEMTEAQLRDARNQIRRLRERDVTRELEYAGLRDKLALFLNGRPAGEIDRPGERGQ